MILEEVKIIYILLIVVVCFMIFWILFVIIMFMVVYYFYLLLRVIYFGMLFFGYVSCMLNLFVYGIRNEVFKIEFVC